VVWFPTAEGALIDFGVGTRGLAPDEGHPHATGAPTTNHRPASLPRATRRRDVDEARPIRTGDGGAEDDARSIPRIREGLPALRSGALRMREST